MLKVVEVEVPSIIKLKKAVCLCDCGKEVTVLTGSLRHGNTRSCGCIRRERCRITGKSNLGKSNLGKSYHGSRERHKQIKTLLEDPALLLSDIAEKVGLTRERVRQIAKRFGTTGRLREKDRKRAKLDAKKAAIAARDRAIVEAWETRKECKNKLHSAVINVHLAKQGMKRCCQCGIPKLLENMSKGAGGKRTSRCSACNAKNSNTYYHRKRLSVGYKPYQEGDDGPIWA